MKWNLWPGWLHLLHLRICCKDVYPLPGPLTTKPSSLQHSHTCLGKHVRQMKLVSRGAANGSHNTSGSTEAHLDNSTPPRTVPLQNIWPFCQMQSLLFHEQREKQSDCYVSAKVKVANRHDAPDSGRRMLCRPFLRTIDLSRSTLSSCNTYRAPFLASLPSKLPRFFTATCLSGTKMKWLSATEAAAIDGDLSPAAFL